MHIEIITTPNEALKESGFGALKACNNVLHTIQQMGHDVRLNICRAKEDLNKVVVRKPDLVILAVKYIPITNEDDIWLSDYFYQNKINFTGSSSDVLEFDSNKVAAKTHLINKGIKTANYFMTIPDQYKTQSELPVNFPLFLKPLDAANGNGIDDSSFVTNFSDYKNKIESLYESFNQPILAEEYLEGSEFTVAVIKTPYESLIVSAVEVIPPVSTNGLRILGSQTKIDDSETLIKIDDVEINASVTRLATDVFNILNVRDFARIDIKMNKHGECLFMEINMVPGMTYGSSYFPEACNIANEFTYDKVIGLLLSCGLDRASIIVPTNDCPVSDDRILSVV